MSNQKLESFKQIVIDSIESTTSNISEARRNIDVAFDILNEKNLNAVSFSPPELLVPMLILYIDADVESVVDMNFELADKLTALYEDTVKFPIYFSVRRK